MFGCSGCFVRLLLNRDFLGMAKAAMPISVLYTAKNQLFYPEIPIFIIIYIIYNIKVKESRVYKTIVHFAMHATNFQIPLDKFILLCFII